MKHHTQSPVQTVLYSSVGPGYVIQLLSPQRDRGNIIPCFGGFFCAFLKTSVNHSNALKTRPVMVFLELSHRMTNSCCAAFKTPMSFVIIFVLKLMILRFFEIKHHGLMKGALVSFAWNHKSSLFSKIFSQMVLWAAIASIVIIFPVISSNSKSRGNAVISLFLVSTFCCAKTKLLLCCRG